MKFNSGNIFKSIKIEFDILGLKCNPFLLLICFATGLLIGMFVICSCCRFNFMEGMSNIEDDMTTGVPGSFDKSRVQTIKKKYSTSGTKLPLPPGEMLFFADTDFKPECCPATYTTSDGCACLTDSQTNYISRRGGNGGGL